jgi:outer membrane protein assembly factor BamB
MSHPDRCRPNFDCRLYRRAWTFEPRDKPKAALSGAPSSKVFASFEARASCVWRVLFPVAVLFTQLPQNIEAAEAAVPIPDALVSNLVAAGHWPSFRGPFASGVADSQNLPEQWDGTKNQNVKWKRAISGLAHSSPIVWGDKLFITTAVSSQGDATFRPGLYGDGDASADRSSHRWLVLCLNTRNGEVLWERVAHEGVPRDKRHVKATYANSTPATDGKRIVAFFGSEGLFAYNLSGTLLWKKELGRLDAGAYDTPSYEWGTASSPILYRDTVIVQCDVQKGSFITALDADTGKTRWLTERKELPSWGTPTVYADAERPELVTNGSNFIRGYDPASGRELWRLGGSSKITAPTPIFAQGLIVVASGRAPERPIFAIRAGAEGDITLPQGEITNRFMSWSKVRKGPYMPTPLIYKGRLYVVNNQGLFDCYELISGREIFSERIQHRGSGFSASPVAADDRLYIAGEDGDVFVYEAGMECNLLAKNPMGEPLMATPALSRGMLFIRGQRHLFAVGK